MARYLLVIALLCALCLSANIDSAFAQGLTGYKTIGGTSPNYATFAAAISALSTAGVGTGGVIFLVRPGIYSEMVSVPYIATASATNPITFRNDTNYVGTVQISPNVTTSGQYGIRLYGCQYVTFNYISVIDTSTGTYPLSYGVFTTNSSATLGAQRNWIKNVTIRLRINGSYSTSGVFQTYSVSPSSNSGAQSDNHYLNLKISKVRYGINNVSSSAFPDSSIEIGSDSVGVNYSKRFTIGAMSNDTIGCNFGNGYGVYCYYTHGLNIHDIDVTNLLSYNLTYAIFGMYLFCPFSATNSNVVKNSRVYDLNTTYATSFASVYGIFLNNTLNSPVKIYNNMVYDLHSSSPSATAMSSYYVYGIYVSTGNVNIDNNTILIDDGGTANSRNYSSTAIYITSGYDTIRNNILANYTGNGTGTSYHVGLYVNSAANWWSNYNCFYIPNSTTQGYVGQWTTTHYSTLTNWRTAAGNPDLNSVYGDPQFISSISPYDVHIQLDQPTSIIEHAGVPPSANPPGYVTTDIDGSARTAPADIGADEGHFLLISGYYTIGGTTPDYSSFTDAINDLSYAGVGNGGATFLVRPGIYSEMVNVPVFPGMGSTNPIVFRNDSTQTGTVQISPAVSGDSGYGIKLTGCQYITFNKISVIDTSTGTFPLQFGIWTTNNNAVQGAQHNWIKNVTIQLRINPTYATYGVNQRNSIAPTSTSGAQSDNHYINLKISKVRTGISIYGNSTYTDVGTEIGSDVVGVNNVNRFVIGAMANDTIGGANATFGIYAFYQNGLKIHDIDITNLKTYGAIYSQYGMYLYYCPCTGGASTPTLIYNNRLYGFRALHTTFSSQYGISTEYSITYGFMRIYNNMIYDLQQTSTAAATTGFYTYGIYNSSYTPTIVNNTIMLNQSGTQNYSSACLYLSSSAVSDTIHNNIFANLGSQSSPTPKHVGVYNLMSNGTYFLSDYNCFYIPNSLGGYFGYNNGAYRSTLAAWQTALTPNCDLNSVVGNPRFISTTSPYDPHLQLDRPSTVVDDGGTSFNYVTTDIDGAVRQSPPDIGADEGRFTNISGFLTIGGTNPDYSTFADAINALVSLGVENGGATYLVRPGIYPEMVTVPVFPNMGLTNRVVFRNDTNFVGTVQISPTASDTITSWGVKLNGCQYVAFDGISVIDTTTSSGYGLDYGYFVTNSSATQGAQYNWIKNATIKLRISQQSTYGVYQICSWNPTSGAGAQNDNQYINLKISKVRCGVYNVSNQTYPDAGIEICSDSVGVNYSKRFTIGALANDTIGGAGIAYGVFTNYTNGVKIHDVDITNLLTYSSNYKIVGICINTPSASTLSNVVKNNRIYNLNTTYPMAFDTVCGIYVKNPNDYLFRIYNNMIYGLHSNAIAGQPTAFYKVFGIYAANGDFNIDNNTILIDDGGNTNCRNYSSIALYAANGSDSIRNNIITNYTTSGISVSFHVGIRLDSLTSWYTNSNCFNVPISSWAYLSWSNNLPYQSLLDWQNAPGRPDAYSFSGDPRFISATSPYNVHIQLNNPASIVDQMGVPYSVFAPGYITEDIDGETRLFPSDIGADEGHFTSISGYITIGGTNSDYSNFTDAIRSLQNNGVESGGVTYLVRPGIYSEQITINPFTGMSPTNPVVFRNDSTQVGTVQISPDVYTSNLVGIKLQGCQYITFNNISVIDTSTRANKLVSGFRVTNASATQGAQHNWIKNATIRLRLGIGVTYGIEQADNYLSPATSSSGTQSDNHYINLKISKVQCGVKVASNSTYRDSCLEIGSDSVGVNYSKRFVIGAMPNDTIGGEAVTDGIYISGPSGINIHDIDVTNLLSYNSNYNVYGIRIIEMGNNPNGSSIRNNRVFNLNATYPSSYSTVVGIHFRNFNGYPLKVYNNMVYGLYSKANLAAPITEYKVSGIESNYGNADIDNNTVLIDDGGNTSCLNYSSAAINIIGGTDSIRNNILANYTNAGNGAAYRAGIMTSSNGTPWSNYNCFYIPNSATNAVIGSQYGVNYNTLSAWQASFGSPDANSIYGDPQLTMTYPPYDLHISLNKRNNRPYLVDQAGIPAGVRSPGYITTDIDGEPRLSPSDIGADEHSLFFIYSPKLNDSLAIGTPDTILWNPAGVSGNVRIDIQRSGSWISLYGSVPNSGTKIWTSVYGPPLTPVRMRIISLIDPTKSDTTDAFSVVKSLTLTHPNGGEILTRNVADTIRWNTHGLTGTVTIKKNLLYPNNTWWVTVVSGLPIGQGYYIWNPTEITSAARIALIPDTPQFASSADTSDANFSVATGRTLTLSRPNGGEQFITGQRDTIRWSANYTGTNIRISLSRHGHNITSLDSIAAHIPVQNGYYAWIPTTPVTDSAQIYIVDETNGLETWSANNFRIVAPSIRMTRPNGGEQFLVGVMDTIRWTTSASLTDSVRISLNRFYPDSSWETLFSRVPNIGYVPWRPTLPMTSSARIRIQYVADPLISTTSDSNFTIQRSIILLSVNSLYAVGDSINLRWWSANIPGDIRFEINRNYPSPDWETIMTGVPNTGIYPDTGSVTWVATRPGTTVCRIRAVLMNYPNLSDSTRSFFLREYPSFIYPDSTTHLRIGSTDSIRWYTGTYNYNVRIQLQRNVTDSSWVTLFGSPTSTITNNGSHAWLLDNPAAPSARLRIQMPGYDTTYMNGTLDIYHPIQYPNGRDTLRIGQQDLIRWQYYNVTGLCTLKLNRSYPTGQWTTIAANIPISMGVFPISPSGSTNLARIAIIPNDFRSAADTSDANFIMLPHTLTVIHPDSNQQVIAGIADSIKWSGTFADTVTGVTISLCRYGMDYSRLVRIATGVPSRVGNNVIAWTPDTNYTDSARVLIENINDASTYAWSSQVFRVVPATISVTKPIAGLWKYAGLQDTIVWTSRSAPTVHLTDTVAVEFRATQTNPWQLGYVQANTGSASWIPPAQGTSNAQIRVRSLRQYPTVTLPGQDTVSGISSMFTVAYWPWSTDPYTANNTLVNPDTAWSPSIPYDQQTNFLPPLDLRFGAQTGGYHNPHSLDITYSSVAMDLPTSNVVNRIWSIEPDTENFTGATLTLRFTSNLLPAGITRPDTVTPQLRVFSSDDGGSTWIYVPGSSNCYRDTINDTTGNTYKIDVINLNQLSQWVVGNGGFRPGIQFPSGGEVLTTGAPYTIRWTRSLLGDSVGVYLNRNYPGTTWETLGGSSSDSLVWTATGTASTNARIRVQSILFPTDCDTSPNNFTIRVPGDFSLQPTPTIPVLSVTYTGGNANLSWTASSGIVTGYKVYRSSTTGHFLPPSGTLLSTIMAPTTTYQDLGASGHYYYRVTAYNTLSSDMAPVVTPPQMILPPTNVDVVRKK